MLYAITDIETTGGYAASNGITEIAVYIHDGQQVVDSFETLVNPHQPIPRFVQSLTGITDEMVQLLRKKGEPVFEAVAFKGIGVFDTLKACAKQVLIELKKGR